MTVAESVNAGTLMAYFMSPEASRGTGPAHKDGFGVVGKVTVAIAAAILPMNRGPGASGWIRRW